ncbi:uncharacterized protein Bfra_004750 [Botrytis fragariae]|uniref:Uncharacterized protein n=1 Tax=Botrytis fragariae TaxID=1964551 RepID=A0A8H6AW02_9HELO|nr:uncharacterized protein Bfra_004750 [Botrytis fragariae]KAF5874734.1 hypothetical protein Bfra_004750 [Botrytis fragariae]
MSARKFISGATPISRSVILLPRDSMHVRLPARGTMASTSMSREYQNDVISESSPKIATEEKIAVKDAEGQKIERPTEVAGKKVDGNNGEKSEKKRKTIAEMDEDLRAKMEGREGAAGVSYEGGKPVTDGFGRGVKSNMFRNGSCNQHITHDRISQSESESQPTRLGRKEKKRHNTAGQSHSRNSTLRKEQISWSENISHAKTEKNEDFQNYERLKKEYRLLSKKKDGRSQGSGSGEREKGAPKGDPNERFRDGKPLSEKEEVQPGDSERGMQDGVAACGNVFNPSTTDNDNDISHSNTDRSHSFSSNGMNTCLDLYEKPRCGLVRLEQDGTDDQEIEKYEDSFCRITGPTTYLLDTMIGSDLILDRGKIHSWRVEGNKDLAHFVLRPLPRLDWRIGEDNSLFLTKAFAGFSGETVAKE